MASVTRNPRPLFVTALPPAADGMEVFYRADSSNGVIWHLRARSVANGGDATLPGEFVGGGALAVTPLGEVNGATLAAATFADLSTAITATVPLAGDYFVQAQASVFFGTTTTASIGIKVGATAPVFGSTGNTSSTTATANTYAAMSLGRLITGVPASTALTLQFRSAVIQSTSAFRHGAGFSITPIRVG